MSNEHVPVRIVVTGSVGWIDRSLLEQVLDDYRARSREHGGSFRIITGMAEGADQIARNWAGANGVTIVAEPLQTGEYPGPMHDYNERMLRWRPDLVLAFKESFGEDWASPACVAGTEHMCRIAMEHNVPVLVNATRWLTGAAVGPISARPSIDTPTDAPNWTGH